MTARVEARGWGWRHAGRDSWAVSDVDLVIEPGERVLLLGASGAGKSTLLRGIAGVLGDEEDGDQSGELLVDGVRPAHARGRAGLVLQDPDAQVILARVGDDVAFGCENLGVPRDEIWRRVPRALDDVGLEVPLDHPTTRLSGGQKQRLALAGVLAMQPGLLLLDEPTANLDPDGAQSVRDSVVAAAARTGATLVVVEHRVDLWIDHIDRVVVLGAEGGVIADGPPERVFAAHSTTLTDAGVWVPGVAPVVPRTAPTGAPTSLLTSDDLAVGRRSFGAKRAQAVATGIRFDALSGRALAVVGPNGAGKSTFAATIAGLIPPAAGHLTASAALAAGAAGPPHDWTSRQLLTRIGMLFQTPEHQLLTGTVRAELEVGSRALGTEPGRLAGEVDDLLHRLRLTDLADANPFTLSGGEKRRLTVAASLITRPRLLVLDEPTYGQDARTWRELAALLDEVRGGGTSLVIATHDRPLVDALADDVLTIGQAVPA
ncbi:ABC transporter ATP-binding protein [Microbacterium faecale]|uniref:ABC transporter ATP-binding protein n=1 Tax=Microbacterium faecale TaxID=1804630 RepID=A0A916Y4L7_9MICO|nr:ATP-binding cassette domain-containing protein [Microbacterium faecale]GGD29467.1 ABC transporter ATP-binding protein [Microbacterium faecale]